MTYSAKVKGMNKQEKNYFFSDFNINIFIKHGHITDGAT